MSPADCTSTIDAAPVRVGETPPPLAVGWPDAVAHTPRSPSPFGPATALPGESRESFSARRGAKHRAQLLPFPEVSSEALASALRHARRLGEEMTALNTADSVAQEFRDDDQDERNAAWMDSLRRYEEALSAVLAVPATGPQMAMEKVRAFFAGQGCTLTADCEPSGPMIGDEPIAEACKSLWRDMQALDGLAAAPQIKPPCPAARLLDEHALIYDACDLEDEIGDWSGGANRRKDEIEEQASWARARSLRGAMYQISLAMGRADLLEGTAASEEERCELDHRYIQRLLASALDVVLQQIGDPMPEVIYSYCGFTHENTTACLSDDPKPFDAAAFIDRYTAAGGQLSIKFNGGGWALENVYPCDPRALAPFLSDMAEPTRFAAIHTVVKARWQPSLAKAA